MARLTSFSKLLIIFVLVGGVLTIVSFVTNGCERILEAAQVPCECVIAYEKDGVTGSIDIPFSLNFPADNAMREEYCQNKADDFERKGYDIITTTHSQKPQPTINNY